MDISLSIDTAFPLSPRDRAILTALLGDAPVTVPAPHRPAGPRAGSAEALAANVTAAAATGRPSAAAAARGRVASQPGVSFTESTAEDESADD